MANKYTTRDILEYNFDPNNYDEIVNAQKKYNSYSDQLYNYGPHVFKNQKELEGARNEYLNQGKFSYDINGDALYQQYKENYINQGKQAMMDTMGQAAAMTGGYGNSYAATVGNQTYQGYLQNLNNMIPQLQQMALDRYNAERQRLAGNLEVWNNEYSKSLAEYESNYDKLFDRTELAGKDLDDKYDRTLTNYNNMITANNDAYWNETETGYKVERDAIEDERYAKEQEEKAKQQLFENNLALDNYRLNEKQVNTAKTQADAELKNNLGTKYESLIKNAANGDYEAALSDLANITSNLDSKEAEKVYEYVAAVMPKLFDYTMDEDKAKLDEKMLSKEKFEKYKNHGSLKEFKDYDEYRNYIYNRYLGWKE